MKYIHATRAADHEFMKGFAVGIALMMAIAW